MEEKLRALIVDDEMDVCFLLSNILKNKNFQTSCVNTISEARTALIKDIPSVVFLDNHLPDGFGINFIKEIRKITPQAKIVMITAHDAKTDTRRSPVGRCAPGCNAAVRPDTTAAAGELRSMLANDAHRTNR